MKKKSMTCFGTIGLTALSIGISGAVDRAYALSGPTAIQIDGGPLGPLSLSGGVSGYFDFLTDTSDKNAVPGSFNGHDAASANLDALEIELQKTTGIIQYTIEIGPYNGTPALGEPPQKASVTDFRASPLYAGYITITPPNSPVSVSAGQVGSLEGYESGFSFLNANL